VVQFRRLFRYGLVYLQRKDKPSDLIENKFDINLLGDHLANIGPQILMRSHLGQLREMFDIDFSQCH